MNATDITDVTAAGADLDLPPRARRFTVFLGGIIQAATVRPSRQEVRTALPCRRRPGRRPCSGELVVRRQEVPDEIEWRCPTCGEGGIIRRPRHTAWDLSPPYDPGPEPVELTLTSDLCSVLLHAWELDTDAGRLVYAANRTDASVVIAISVPDFEHLADQVVMAAGLERRPARRRRLDEISDRLEALLDVAL